ncbi:MAG: site-2 protease family protein [Actinomycetota bacterium]|nr:site-2 protease family protein [Actinomycetota bacterium]
MSEPSTPERVRPRGGIPLGAPFGIPIFLSPSWFLVAGVIAVTFAPSFTRRGEAVGALQYALGAGFAVLLCASVLAHELGHCLVGKALGLPVRRLTIFLLGGVSVIDREPETAGREYLVAVVGPMVSLVLAGVAWVLGEALGGSATLPGQLGRLTAGVNLVVTVFNLLPGLPLDGGRVLRAAIWQVTGRKGTGTRAAAWAGRGLAVLLVASLPLSRALGGGSSSLSNTVFTLLVAAFIYTGAGAALTAAKAAEQAAKLAGLLPRVAVRALLRRAMEVRADVPLAEALRRAHEQGARGLVVVDGSGRPDGVVSEAAVVATPEHRRPWVNVGALARRVDQGLLLADDLAGDAMVEALRRNPASEYVVVDSAGGIVGVLAAADVARTLDPTLAPAT